MTSSEATHVTTPMVGAPRHDVDRGQSVAEAQTTRAPVGVPSLSEAKLPAVSKEGAPRHGADRGQGRRETQCLLASVGVTHFDDGQACREAQRSSAAVNGVDRGQSTFDTHRRRAPVGVTPLSEAKAPAVSRTFSPRSGAGLGQSTSEAHRIPAPAGVPISDGGQTPADAHGPDVAVGVKQPPAVHGQAALDAHGSRADAAGALLLVLADAVDDLERTRIANENRLRSLTTTKGLNGTTAAAALEGIVAGLSTLETDAVKALEKAMRAHPLGPWVKRTPGLGLKQTARLLAAIGDPLWNSAAGRPRRGVAELWAFCGYHTVPAGSQSPIEAQCSGAPGRNVAPKLRKGQQANWNSDAKMRAHLVAESCIKARTSPYRAVYDAARAKDAESVHPEPCPRCGPSGHPAPAGSLLSLGHQHARALRKVAKAVLRDLFLEAKRAQKR